MQRTLRRAGRRSLSGARSWGQLGPAHEAARQWQVLEGDGERRCAPRLRGDQARQVKASLRDVSYPSFEGCLLLQSN